MFQFLSRRATTPVKGSVHAQFKSPASTAGVFTEASLLTKLSKISAGACALDACYAVLYMPTWVQMHMKSKASASLNGDTIAARASRRSFCPGIRDPSSRVRDPRGSSSSCLRVSGNRLRMALPNTPCLVWRAWPNMQFIRRSFAKSWACVSSTPLPQTSSAVVLAMMPSCLIAKTSRGPPSR
jgi:hypothetical protein